MHTSLGARRVSAAVYVMTMSTTAYDLMPAVERVVAACRRMEQHKAHLDAALQYPRVLAPTVRVDEIADALLWVANAVLDECQRARGTNPEAVTAARARVNDLTIALAELCNEMVLTEASA